MATYKYRKTNVSSLKGAIAHMKENLSTQGGKINDALGEINAEVWRGSASDALKNKLTAVVGKCDSINSRLSSFDEVLTKIEEYQAKCSELDAILQKIQSKEEEKGNFIGEIIDEIALNGILGIDGLYDDRDNKIKEIENLESQIDSMLGGV